MHRRASSAPTIDRASPTDLMEQAAGTGRTPSQFAAILTLAGPVLPADVVAALDARVRTVPRLRQRLVRAPLGCGRPYWVDDPTFRIERHVHVVSCPSPRDEAALLDVAAEVTSTRLPDDRPLWAVHLVTGLADGRAALVVVVHHVLTDGLGGLAVLSRLMDATEPPVPWQRAPFPQAPPTRRELVADAWASRWQAARHLPSAPRRLRDAWVELRGGRPGPTPRTSLNRPTGPRRQLVVVRADLAPLASAAHAHAATVNDVLLTAVGGCLGAVLEQRGESADWLVVSVPTSVRGPTNDDRLGNRIVGAVRSVPTCGAAGEGLAAVAAGTRADRARPTRGDTTVLLAPAGRIAARLGLIQWLADSQRMVTTTTANVRGPTQRLSFLGVPVAQMAAVIVLPGNVTIGFAALSYAGTLTVTVVADPDRWPDLPVAAAALQEQLDRLARDPDAPVAAARHEAAPPGRPRSTRHDRIPRGDT